MKAIYRLMHVVSHVNVDLQCIMVTSGVYFGFGSFVVMYRTKPFITSTSLSPTFTYTKQNTHHKY